MPASERVLVLGGSFDPPHKGHRDLLLAAARRIRPDRILLVPAYQAPLKGLPGAAPEERLRLMRRFLRALPRGWRRRTGLELSEMEARRRVYTVETLRRLRRERPGAELHFALGSDAAASFGLWREPGQLRKLAAWWVGMRPGYGRGTPGARGPASGGIPASFRRLPGRFPAISSTAVRLAASSGGDWEDLVPKGVAALMRKRGLYGLGLLEALGGALKKGRFAHTLAVARLAAVLAQKHGLDASRAVLAAVLHDCARCMPPEEMVRLSLAWGVRAPGRSAIIRRQPKLMHAYLSAELARRRFGVSDPAVLSAIRKHTLGAARMSPLDRLIYVADAASEDRKHPAARRLRRLALRDLDGAMAACLRGKLAHARGGGSWVHPISLALWKSTAR